MSTTDDLRALLDEWKTLAKRATVPIPDAVVPRELVAARAAAQRFAARAVPRLIAAVEAVLEVHRPGDGASQGFTVDGYGYIEPYCAGCEASDEYAVEWPCPTITAVRSALIGDNDD